MSLNKITSKEIDGDVGLNILVIGSSGGLKKLFNIKKTVMRQQKSACYVFG